MCVNIGTPKTINFPFEMNGKLMIFRSPHTFLSSLLALKRGIAVTILLRCMCVCASIWVCLGHNSYIYGWISKLFDTVVVLGRKSAI